LQNALIKQFQQLFSMEDVELDIEDDALKAVAQAAIKRKTGARGLRSIVEKSLLDTMYDLPSMTDVSKVILTKEAVEGTAKPVVVHAAEALTQASGDNAVA